MIRLDFNQDGSLDYCNYESDGSTAAPLCEGRATYEMNDSEIKITGIRLSDGEPKQTVHLKILKQNQKDFRLALKSGMPKTKTEKYLTKGSYFVYDETVTPEGLDGNLGIPADFDGTLTKGAPEYWFAGNLFTVQFGYQKDGKTMAEAGVDCYSGEAIRLILPYMEE